MELVSDTHIPRRFERPPQPVMADSGAEMSKTLCPQFGWRFCPKPRRGDEDRHWYTCEARQFVAKVSRAFIMTIEYLIEYLECPARRAAVRGQGQPAAAAAASSRPPPERRTCCLHG